MLYRTVIKTLGHKRINGDTNVIKCHHARRDGDRHLSTLTTDAPCELHVLGHQRGALRVDGTEVGVLKETHEIRFSGLLQALKERGEMEAAPRTRKKGSGNLAGD